MSTLTRDQLIQALDALMRTADNFAFVEKDEQTASIMAEAVFRISVAVKQTTLEITPEEFERIMRGEDFGDTH